MADSGVSLNNQTIVAPDDGILFVNTTDAKSGDFSLLRVGLPDDVERQKEKVSALGVEVEVLKDDLDETNKNLNDFIDYSADKISYSLDRFFEGKGAIWSTGDTDVAPSSPIPYATEDFQCVREIYVKKGDRFIITTSGGASARAYAFTDNERNIVEKSAANATLTKQEIIAPVDGILLVNTSYGLSGKFELYRVGFVNNTESRYKETRTDIKAVNDKIDGPVTERMDGLNEDIIETAKSVDVVNNKVLENSAIFDAVDVPTTTDNTGYLYKDTTDGKPTQSSSSYYSDFIELDDDKLYKVKVTKYESDASVGFYASPSFDDFVGLDIADGKRRLVDDFVKVPGSAKYMVVFTRNKNIAIVTSYNKTRAATCEIERVVRTIQSQLNNGALDGLVTNAGNVFNKHTCYLEEKQLYKNTSNVLVDSIDNQAYTYYMLVGKTKLNKFYNFKVFSDDEYGSLSTLNLIVAESIAEGNTVIDGAANLAYKRGYVQATVDNNLYIRFVFKSKTSTEEINRIVSDVADNIYISETSSQAYPTAYVPYQKLGFSIAKEEISSDTVVLFIVDSFGRQVGDKVQIKTGSGTVVQPSEINSNYLNSVQTITYKLQPNSISEAVVVGNGWSGNLAKGYTNVQGQTDPLEFDLSHIPSGERIIFSFNCGGITSESNDLNVCVGDNPTVKSYNGGTSFNLGFIVGGGNLKIYPAYGFASTITNLSIRRIDENGSESITLTVDNVYAESNRMVTAFWNIAIGSRNYTMTKLVNGSRNVGLGYKSMDALVSGNRNVAIGTYSMPFVTEGENNISIGADTLYPLKKANGCVGIGKAVLTGTEAEDCVAIGGGAMSQWSFEGARKECVAIGTDACPAAKERSTHVGYKSGAVVSGVNNTAVGYRSMGVGTRTTIDVTGSELTCIGYMSQIDDTTTAKAAVNSTAIGANTKITKSNQVVIGNSAVEEVIIGGKKIIFYNDGSIKWENV